MSGWILILTLLGDGTVITHVPGFANQEACAEAGNLWLANRPKAWTLASAVCVNAGGKP